MRSLAFVLLAEPSFRQQLSAVAGLRFRAKSKANSSCVCLSPGLNSCELCAMHVGCCGLC